MSCEIRKIVIFEKYQYWAALRIEVTPKQNVRNPINEIII